MKFGQDLRLGAEYPFLDTVLNVSPNSSFVVDIDEHPNTEYQPPLGQVDLHPIIQ